MKKTEIINYEELRYAIDIPKVNGKGEPIEEWYCVKMFKNKEEAIEYAQKYFGADENGNICLLSNL